MIRKQDNGEDGETAKAGEATGDDSWSAPGEEGPLGDDGSGGEDGAPGEDSAPVELPITDVLDLHSFRPAEVPDVVREYLDAAYGKGIRDLRIIHGRGIGVQRQTVRVILGRDPRVVAFGDAPAGAGGWGATWVRLRD